jgi:hypothetical protein
VHLDWKNYREVEVLKSSGYLLGRKQVRYPRRHQALIRAQLERFWIYEELFRQHPASRIDDAVLPSSSVAVIDLNLYEAGYYRRIYLQQF